MSQRTYVVTGSASGIGAATRNLLEASGHRVIGVDLHDAEVIADLATRDGRRTMIEQVRGITDGRLGGVIASAGVADGRATPGDIMRVNYFGAVATLDGLRPFLAADPKPRAVVVASMALWRSTASGPIVDSMLSGDEEAAVEMVADDVNGMRAYLTSKRAIARWVRRAAASNDWAGAGIAVNVVAPAVIDTPMSAPQLTAENRPILEARVPMPLCGVGAPAEYVASALAWLTSSDNGIITGQVIFADGGHESIVRGDDIWDT